MAYPFPDDVRNPDREDPNPFAEDHIDDSSETVASEGDFQASGTAGDYRPEYVATEKSRVAVVLALGIGGLLGSLSGWTAYTNLTHLILMPFLSLAFSMPAVALGWSDAIAVRAGARKKDNSGWLVVGILLGLLAIANTALFVIVGLFVWDLLWF